MGTQTAFQKPDERSLLVFCDENNQRQGPWRFARQDEFQLPRVFFGGRFRPKRCEQRRECAEIRRLREPHTGFHRESQRCHFAVPETKIALGIIMCTPLLPSTSSVMCKSAATLASM